MNITVAKCLILLVFISCSEPSHTDIINQVEYITQLNLPDEYEIIDDEYNSIGFNDNSQKLLIRYSKENFSLLIKQLTSTVHYTENGKIDSIPIGWEYENGIYRFVGDSDLNYDIIEIDRFNRSLLFELTNV